jgi:hypothetical protein
MSAWFNPNFSGGVYQAVNQRLSLPNNQLLWIIALLSKAILILEIRLAA